MKQLRKIGTTNEPLANASDMFVVHGVLRREFGLMSPLVLDVPAGDQSRAAVVADHIALVSMFLQIHHSGEDKHIWPLLRQRGAEDIASIVAAMEEEHESIHRKILKVGNAVESWRESAQDERRDALADAISELVPIVNNHLADEEKRVVPLIEKYVTASEYALLPQEGAAHIPPDKLPTVFGMVMYEAAPAVIDTIVAQLPPEVQPVIRDLGRNAYASYAKQLYGTATPPRSTELS
jgi:hemerythrin-like domain-containing protein